METASRMADLIVLMMPTEMRGGFSSEFYYMMVFHVVSH